MPKPNRGQEGGSGGSGGGNLLRNILIGVGVLALLGLGAFLFMKKKSGSAPSASVGSSGYTPQPFPAAAPQTAPGAYSPPPGAPFAAPVTPNVDASKATVVINPAEAQRMAQQHAAAASGAAPQPVYDEALGAWVVNDPARGRLRHDPATDTWKPV